MNPFTVLLMQAAEAGLGKVNPEDPQDFMTQQMEGALANGTRVVKVSFEKGDFHAIGTRATILGSLGPVEGGEFGYFVHWDDMPDHPVFVRGRKIRPVE